MSKVIDTQEKRVLSIAGFKIDKIIRRRRRERDLKIKQVKFVRNQNER
jgi:hypothetical protein